MAFYLWCAVVASKPDEPVTRDAFIPSDLLLRAFIWSVLLTALVLFAYVLLFLLMLLCSMEATLATPLA